MIPANLTPSQHRAATATMLCECGEIWAPLQAHEGRYEISTLGRIRALPYRYPINHSCGRVVYRKASEHLLKPTINNGYYGVGLRSKNGAWRRKSLHRLLAFTFISNPEKKPHINHKNGVKTDNRLDNLEWCTAKENINHALETNLICRKGVCVGTKNSQHKLKPEEVLLIRRLLKTKTSRKLIAKMFKIAYGTVRHLSGRDRAGNWMWLNELSLGLR